MIWCDQIKKFKVHLRTAFCQPSILDILQSLPLMNKDIDHIERVRPSWKSTTEWKTLCKTQHMIPSVALHGGSRSGLKIEFNLSFLCIIIHTHLHVRCYEGHDTFGAKSRVQLQCFCVLYINWLTNPSIISSSLINIRCMYFTDKLVNISISTVLSIYLDQHKNAYWSIYVLIYIYIYRYVYIGRASILVNMRDINILNAAFIRSTRGQGSRCCAISLTIFATNRSCCCACVPQRRRSPRDPLLSSAPPRHRARLQTVGRQQIHELWR